MGFNIPLSHGKLTPAILKKDKRESLKIGKIGIGEKAIYLNSYFIDRMYYIPFSNVTRVYKRVAMSKGGYSGKGLFASIPYIVVEYDGGKEKQCNCKYEDRADQILNEVGKRYPDIPLISRKAKEKMEADAAMEKKRYKTELSETARKSIERLEDAEKRLLKQKELYERLAVTAKTKRMAVNTGPYYKYLKYLMLGGSLFAALLGVFAVNAGYRFETYFVFFAFALMFFFFSLKIRPTGVRNEEEADREFAEAVEKMRPSLTGLGLTENEVPAHYLHPFTLRRMVRLIKEGQAETPEEALFVLKEELRKTNSSVTVSARDYEEIVAIKPMFLCMDYR